MVQILLNIAYAPRAVTKDFVFGTGISQTFKKTMDKSVLIDWTDETRVRSFMTPTGK